VSGRRASNAFVSKELDDWKDRINLVADFSSIHFPDFFARQRSDLLRWCAKRCGLAALADADVAVRQPSQLLQLAERSSGVLDLPNFL
jgi:hypothetical protein